MWTVGPQDACMIAVLREIDVELSRVIGLGSDGASVMMGSHGGVGDLLKQANPFSIKVHCVAHRAALAALDAEKSVNNITSYKNTISSVYSFYKHSATRTNRLRQLTTKLHNEDMVSLKQPCAVPIQIQVRFISTYLSVNLSFQKNIPTLQKYHHQIFN